MLTAAFLGPLCAFLSSVTWSFGSVGYARLSRSYSAFAVNFARALVALPLFLVAAFLTGGGFEQLRPSHFGWFTLSMIASYGLGDVLFLWSTRSLGVPVALAIASSYPLWTAGAGTLIRGEKLTGYQALGLCLAVAGVVTVILTGQKTSNETQPSKNKQAFRNGLILAFICSLLWGLNGLAAAQGGRDLTTPVGNSVRMFLALGISTIFGRLVLPSEPLLLPLGEFARSFWLFAAEAFGGSYLFMYGLSHSSLAIGSTLSSLAPVLSVPVVWLLGLEKVSFIRTLGIFLVGIGVSLLVGGGQFL